MSETLDFTVMTEKEVMDWARHRMGRCHVGDRAAIAVGQEEIRQAWIAWTDARKKREPKVDAVTGEEVPPPPEKHCVDCDAVIKRTGGKGRLPSRCPDCQARHKSVAQSKE